MALRPSVQAITKAASGSNAWAAFAFAIAVGALGLALYQIAQAQKEIDNAR